MEDLNVSSPGEKAISRKGKFGLATCSVLVLLAAAAGGLFLFNPTPATAQKNTQQQPAPAAQPAAEAGAKTETPAAPAANAAAAPAAAQAPQPFGQQLDQAKITVCRDTVNALGQAAIGGSYTAMSEWNTDKPDNHLFQSLIGIDFRNQAGLRGGVSVVTAAPVTGGGCEGNLVSVVPSRLSCDAIIQQSFTGVVSENTLSGVPVFVTNRGRVMLVPSGESCVVVTVANYIPAPAKP